MKINKTNYTWRIEKLYKQNSKENSPKLEEKNIEKDRVVLSEKGKEIQKYEREIKALEHQNRLNKIKLEIKSGTYEISSHELAKKILEAFNNDGTV